MSSPQQQGEAVFWTGNPPTNTDSTQASKDKEYITLSPYNPPAPAYRRQSATMELDIASKMMSHHQDALDIERRATRRTMKFLFIAMMLLMLSIVANFGLTWYAVKENQNTGTSTDAQGHEHLVGHDGHALRVDRSKDSAALNSQMSDDTLNKLERLQIIGPAGTIGIVINSWARYSASAYESQHGSVVVLYSALGSIELDGSNMVFQETVASAFERAGFETGRIFRRDASNTHRYHIRSLATIMGIFLYLTDVELSQISVLANHSGVNPSDPFADSTYVFMRQVEYVDCEYAFCTEAGLSDGQGAKLLPPTDDDATYDEQFRDQRLYLTRTRTSISHKINGVWYSYSETTFGEYTDAIHVELEADGDMSHYVQRVDSGVKFYCDDTDTNGTAQRGLTMETEANDDPTDQTVMTFDGMTRFLDGTYVRKYLAHENGTDPYDLDNLDNDTFVVPYYETTGDASDRRLYSLMMSDIVQFAVEEVLTDSDALAHAFAQRSQHMFTGVANGDSTDDFLDQTQQNCSSYGQPEQMEDILWSAEMQALNAPPPLVLYDAHALDISGWVFTPGNLTRMRERRDAMSEDTFYNKELTRSRRQDWDALSCVGTPSFDIGIASVEGEKCSGADSDCGALVSVGMSAEVTGPKFPSPSNGPCTRGVSGSLTTYATDRCGFSAEGQIGVFVQCDLGIKIKAAGKKKKLGVTCRGDLYLGIDTNPYMSGGLDIGCGGGSFSAGIDVSVSEVGVICAKKSKPRFKLKVYTKVNIKILWVRIKFSSSATLVNEQIPTRTPLFC